jgi:hypothetical protein
VWISSTPSNSSCWDWGLERTAWRCLNERGAVELDIEIL